MQLNSLVFPAPKPSYTAELLTNELIWVPSTNYPEKSVFPSENAAFASKKSGFSLENTRELGVFSEKSQKYATRSQENGSFLRKSEENARKSAKTVNYIPCLLLESQFNSNPELIVLFFHGNGEDIFLAYELVEALRNTLKLRVLAPEYPSYGVYRDSSSSSEQILTDAEKIYSYLTKVLGYQEKNIILIGRSIGTGPATHLASRKSPGALVLLSAFTSIQAVIGNFAGFLKLLVKERFDNLRNFQKVTCPTLLIHGIRDKLISYEHSLKLHDACKGPCELQLPKEMSHFEFDFQEDVSVPILLFLQKWKFRLKTRADPYKLAENPPVFPIEVYFKPYYL